MVLSFAIYNIMSQYTGWSEFRDGNKGNDAVGKEITVFFFHINLYPKSFGF